MDDLGKWLGDQAGNILSFVGGIVVSALFYWISLRPKRFGWQLISSNGIVSAKGRSLPLKVVYDGQEVSSPNIIVMKIGNAGKSEITAEDYDGPVRIQFNKSSLLACDVSGRLNEQITASVLKDTSSSVVVEPTLLNPGEWIILQFVTDGPLEIPTVHARVAGQTSPVNDVAKAHAKTWLPFLLGGLFISLGIPIAISIFFLGEARAWIVPIMSIGLVVTFFSAIQMSRTPAWAKQPKEKKAHKK